MHRRTIVRTTGNYKEYLWKFELRYSEVTHQTGKHYIQLKSLHPEKLFRYHIDTQTNIIGFMQEIIIKETTKLKPECKFENICQVQIGFSEIKLIANFSASIMPGA